MNNASWIKRILTDDPSTQGFAAKTAQKITLQVYIQPGASNTEIIGLHDTRLKIKVAAPPVEEKANKELCAFLAHEFDVPKSNVSVTKGRLSRSKTIEVVYKIK